MLMILGFILIAAGIGMALFFALKIHRRPQVQAQVISTETKTGFPPFKKKPKPFARVNYQFEEHTFEDEEIMLRTKDAKAGDTLTLIVDPSNPKDSQEFAQKKDYIGVTVITLIGVALVVFSFWAIDALS